MVPLFRYLSAGAGVPVSDGDVSDEGPSRQVLLDLCVAGRRQRVDAYRRNVVVDVFDIDRHLRDALVLSYSFVFTF